MSQNPFDAFLDQYEHDWIGLVRDVLNGDPDEYQQEVLLAAQHGERRISVRSGHGVGKMEPNDTIIDTPRGRRRFGDLRIGDVVFGRDGHPASVVGVFPKGTRPMYRVTFDDGTWVRCGGEHLWTVRGRNARRKRLSNGWETLSTEDILARGVTRRNGIATAAQWELPRHEPVQYPQRDHLIPPYVLGVWLGDGTGSAPEITSADEEMPSLLAESGWRVRRMVASTRSRARKLVLAGLARPLRTLGVFGKKAHEKRVPRSYLEAPVADRLAILQGLMDTDGTTGQQGCSQFCSTSEGLADDVVWLVRSLGGKAIRCASPKQPFYRDAHGNKVSGRLAYTVTVRLPDHLSLFRLARKRQRVTPTKEPRYLSRWITSIEPDGESPARCIMVDRADGLYLTKDFVVTHNTTVLAWCIVCHTLTRFPQATVATAPTSSQLFDALAAQTKAWFKKLPPALLAMFEIKSESITHGTSPEESFVSFRTSRPEMPEALAGVHSDHVLLIGDEASGIPEQVYIAAAGSMSGEHATTILAGNPVRTQGLFFDTHHDLAHMWRTIHISCEGHPRVAADFLADMEARYGKDTNDYRVRVLGEFPRAEADTVIPYELIQLAMDRDVAPSLSGSVWGVDCARFGADRSALAKRRGNAVEGCVSWKDLDTMQLAGAIKAEWENTPSLDRPTSICVDAIGLGAGVADRLRELGLPAIAINVSESPALGGNYLNLKAELWFQCKDWFTQRACTLNNHKELAAELSWPRFGYTSAGKLRVEGKSDMKKRTKKSPDLADAFVLTFAAPATSALYGSAASSNWNEPLERVIPCV